MYSLSKFSGKKVISLITLVAFCSTPIVFDMKEANATGIIGRTGSRVMTSLSRVGSNISNGSIRILRQPTGTNNVTENGTRLSTLGNSQINSTVQSNNGRNSNTNILDAARGAVNVSLSRRLNALERNLQIEDQRRNHPLNKVIVASGLVSGAMLITGVVSGIIQQTRIMELNEKQVERDQKLQKDLSNMRDVFNNKEVPEAEKHIIDYYKDNFGIDITNNNR